MSQYIPNFKAARTRSRAFKALSFVELHVSKYSVPIARNTMYQYFGNTSQPQGAFLKNLVLIDTDQHYNSQTGKCKKYKQNAAGVQSLKQLLGLAPDHPPSLTSELQQQFDSGDFVYKEKSNRSYTPAQFIRSEIRAPILANNGYRHHYDIMACAPRLLLQRAQQIKPDFAAPAIEQYVADRKTIREQIALECSISTEQVKTVINSLLQGAYLSSSRFSRMPEVMNHDYAAIQRLKLNQFLTAFRADLKRLWDCLRAIMPERFSVNKNGKTFRVRLNGRDKSALYRELESQVAQVIRKHLKHNHTRALWIHDGWCCDTAIDIPELIAQVRTQTGFVLELDWSVYQ